MDLRDYLEALKENGELVEASAPVHWDEEAAGICAMNNRVGGPAIHFKNVVGYSGTSLVSNLFSAPGSLFWQPGQNHPWSKLAIALRLDKHIEYEPLMDELLSRLRVPILPTKTQAGECKEVVQTGKDVDLYSLPFTRQTARDGGRYGTAGVVVAKDYGSDWVNWGVHRFMIHSADTAVINIRPETDLAKIWRKYEANNESMPVCIFFGGDPACFAAAAMPVPTGVSEAEVAGCLAQDPILLVKAETNDLLVPADAEVVIEGEILAGQRLPEGPFPEYVRYSEVAPGAVFKVKAITRRKDAILPFVAEGCKVSDSMAVISIGASVQLTQAVRTERMFKVRWINLPVETKLGLCVVATQVPYKGYNYFIEKFLLSKKRRMWFDKIMIVDSDINPVDLWEVLNDFAQKTDVRTGKGVRIITDMEYPLSPAAGWANAAERARGSAGTVVFDCTWKDNWPKDEIPVRVSFENSFPVEIQQRVLERWKKLGFKEDPWVKPVYEEWSRGHLMAR